MRRGVGMEGVNCGVHAGYSSGRPTRQPSSPHQNHRHLPGLRPRHASRFYFIFCSCFSLELFFQHPPHPTAISPLSRPEPCLSKIAGGLLGLRSGGGEGRGGSGSRLLPAAPQGRPRRLCWPGPPAAAASTRTSIDPRLLVVLLSGPPVGPQRPPAQEVA